ncbi:hypothetical protein BC938DRAFT_478128, partial [Jimgerdemannia flammicorona]
PKAKPFARILNQLEEESRPLESEIKREAEVTSHLKQGDRLERENAGNAMMDVTGNGSGGSSDESTPTIPSDSTPAFTQAWAKFRDKEPSPTIGVALAMNGSFYPSRLNPETEMNFLQHEPMPSPTSLGGFVNRSKRKGGLVYTDSSQYSTTCSPNSLHSPTASCSDDRFEPYSTTTPHKRRAVSPSLGSPVLTGVPSPPGSMFFNGSPTGSPNPAARNSRNRVNIQDASGGFSRMSLS